MGLRNSKALFILSFSADSIASPSTSDSPSAPGTSRSPSPSAVAFLGGVSATLSGNSPSVPGTSSSPSTLAVAYLGRISTPTLTRGVSDLSSVPNTCSSGGCDSPSFFST